MFHQVENKAPASAIKGSKQNFFQPKLTINEPGDIYEKEADAVADKVMRTPAASDDQSFFSPTTIQRKCAASESENKIQKKPSETIIQRDENDKEEDKFKLRTPFESMQYSGVNSTLFNRGVLFPSSFGDSAQQEWGRQYQLYSTLGAGSLAGGILGRFGLTAPGGDWNAWLANTTTPLAVDSALSRDFPTFNEQEERRGGLPAPTTLSIPVASFKLEDGSPDTPAEREADSVAEKVVSSNHTDIPSATIQKKCAAYENEELHRKESDSQTSEASPQTESYISTLSSQGNSLNESEKKFL